MGRTKAGYAKSTQRKSVEDRNELENALAVVVVRVTVIGQSRSEVHRGRNAASLGMRSVTINCS